MNCAVTGLIKVCLAYENGLLPGNLHYKEPNPNNKSLKAGILKVHPPPACPDSTLLPFNPARHYLLGTRRCLQRL